MTTNMGPESVGPAGARLTLDAPRVPRVERSDCQLALLQVQAIDSFTQALGARELALQATKRSREMRLDSARSLDVLRRQHRALVERTSAQLRVSGQLLRARTVLRVVLAHRNAWFLDKVSRSLQDNDVEVLAQTDNGADAIGYCVAEQPDLVLLEDSLEMVPGEQVVRQIKLYVPHAVKAAQTAESSGVPRLVEAGADAVFTRQVPPLEIVRSLLALDPV